MRPYRSNNLFIAFLLGGLLGILIRRYRAGRQACAASARPQKPPPPVIPPPVLHENGLPPWHWN